MQVPPRWIDIWAGDLCFSCFSFHNYPLLNIISNGTRPCRRLFRILFFCISRIYYLAINCFGHRRSMMLQLFWIFRTHSADTSKYFSIPLADPIPLANLPGHSTTYYILLPQYILWWFTRQRILHCFFNGLLNKLATAAVLQSNGKRIQMRSQPLMAGHFRSEWCGKMFWVRLWGN